MILLRMCFDEENRVSTTTEDSLSKPRPSGLKKGFTSDSPLPTRVVSNEEFSPPHQTNKQAHVDWLIHTISEKMSQRLGIDRREFLRTTGGMAVALLAMNHVFGKFFDILEVEAAEPHAFQERRGEPLMCKPIMSVRRLRRRDGGRLC